MANWPDHVHDILGGDLGVVLGYRTPMGGAVLTPVTPLGTYDEAAGTVTFTSSLGNFGKLKGIGRDARVALCYHAREHGRTAAPHVLLVQGRASFPAASSPEDLAAAMGGLRDLVVAPRTSGLMGWIGRRYNADRVPVTVAVERIVEWPSDRMEEVGAVHGAPLPDAEPAPHDPPAGGTGPRIPAKAWRKPLERGDHVLVGFAGADGFPVVRPVTAIADGDELLLGAAGDLPSGGRRAGVLLHWFGAGLLPQANAVMTGWLEVGGGVARFAPHTKTGYDLPVANETAYHLASGLSARVGYRKAVKQGLVEDGRWVGPRPDPAG